jgi:hypothetical protein
MWMGAVERARAFGIDISLLRSCLLRSPEQRLRMACDDATGIAHFRRRSADYSGLLDRLLASEVRFVLVGSMAAAALGSAYIPNDLDICYDTTRENVETLLPVLQPIHPRARNSGEEQVLDADAILLNPLLALRTDEGDLDLLAGVDGVGDYRECFAVAEKIPWSGMNIPVLAVEGLIVAMETHPLPGETGPLMALQALWDLRQPGNQQQCP